MRSLKTDQVYVFSEELFLRAWRSDPKQDAKALSARCLEAAFLFEETTEAHKRLAFQAQQPAPAPDLEPARKPAKSKRARRAKTAN